MNIILNGTKTEIPDGLTVAGLLAHLAKPAKGRAIEVNREIVPRGRHDQHLIAENDVVEITQLVGGG